MTTPVDDGTHGCPAPGCRAPVPRGHLACRKDWARVDKRTQQWVYRAFRDGDVGEHMGAISDAISQIVASVEAEQKPAVPFAVSQPPTSSMVTGIVLSMPPAVARSAIEQEQWAADMRARGFTDTEIEAHRQRRRERP